MCVCFPVLHRLESGVSPHFSIPLPKAIFCSKGNREDLSALTKHTKCIFGSYHLICCAQDIGKEMDGRGGHFLIHKVKVLLKMSFP